MIFFDLDGTLLDHDLAERKGAIAVAHAMSLSPSEHPDFVKKWRAVSDRYMALYLAGAIDFERQRHLRLEGVTERQLDTTEAKTIFEVYLHAYEAGWSLDQDAMPCLYRLAQKYPLGIISNGNPTQQHKKLSALNIEKFFTVVVTSEEVGVSKPSRRIFDYACEKAEILNGSCTYISDRLDTDAVAARDAGLTGYWLDRHDLITTPAEAILRLTTLDNFTP